MKRTQQMDAVERVYESDLSEVDLLGDEYQTVGKLMTTGATSLLWMNCGTLIYYLTTNTGDGPLRCYHDWLLLNARFQDGVQGMCLNSVVAVQGDRKNGIPWLGRVVSINTDTRKVIYKLYFEEVYFVLINQQVKVCWLHNTGGQYYEYQNSNSDKVYQKQ
jgi:hypothetical protein